ncbi:MAG: hypothetical protein LBR36_09325 [Bacteroidales bacterium]|jgi:hypothetical protein|nr:hypothetical protein [Bacteroidales bacterium]
MDTFEYYIEKDTVYVDFKDDDRIFVLIGFRRQDNNQYVFSTSDAIDNLGYHYAIYWCED